MAIQSLPLNEPGISFPSAARKATCWDEKDIYRSEVKVGGTCRVGRHVGAKKTRNRTRPAETQFAC
jgi:hypothetical protein